MRRAGLAFELVVALGALGGVAAGVSAVAGGAGVTDAAAATSAQSTAPLLRLPMRATRARTPAPSQALAAAAVSAVAPEVVAPPATVFPAADRQLLSPLDGPLAKVKVNRGGSSLSFRLEFATGGRAAWKPMQNHPQSDPRRELAAYRMDRLLGIGHVPPARAVAFTVDQLVAAAPAPTRDYVAGRLADEATVGPDGLVRGVASWWIPDIADLEFEHQRADDPAGMGVWADELSADEDIPPEHRALLAQISSCVVFDVLIDNADRWSGSNAKGSPDGQILYFMDNTLSFSSFTVGHVANLHPLRRVQVFSRSLIAHVRALREDTVAAALAPEGGPDADDAGLAPLLKPDEIRAILARRDHVVQYVDDLIAEFGEDAVLAFP